MKKQKNLFLKFLVSILLIVIIVFFIIYSIPSSRATINGNINYYKAMVNRAIGEKEAWEPAAFYIPVEPNITNTEENRSVDNYNEVIDQFNVTTTNRYRKTGGATFCNIFSWDVTVAMGCEIPHYYTIDLLPAPSDNFAYAGAANIRYQFLEWHGDEFGWSLVTAEQAQNRANQGFPTIGIYQNPDCTFNSYNVASISPSGHVVVIRPSNKDFNAKKGPLVAQAGVYNYDSVYLTYVMGDKMDQMLFYTHD